MSSIPKKFLTLDAIVFVAALKVDEPYRGKCSEIFACAMMALGI